MRLIILCGKQNVRAHSNLCMVQVVTISSMRIYQQGVCQELYQCMSKLIHSSDR